MINITVRNDPLGAEHVPAESIVTACHGDSYAGIKHPNIDSRKPVSQRCQKGRAQTDCILFQFDDFARGRGQAHDPLANLSAEHGFLCHG